MRLIFALYHFFCSFLFISISISGHFFVFKLLLAQNCDSIFMDVSMNDSFIFVHITIHCTFNNLIRHHHALNMSNFELFILSGQFLKFLLSFFIVLLRNCILFGFFVQINKLLNWESLFIIGYPQGFKLFLYQLINRFF